MNNLDIQDILNKLLPKGATLGYDIMIYLIFFLALIAMFMQSDKQLVTTLMLAGTAGLAVIAKLGVFEPRDFGSLIINAGMLVLPLITAGITKAKKSVPLAVIGGIMGGVYFFAFWLFEQRGGF